MKGGGMEMSAKGGGAPEMSVVVVTPDCYETVRKTMRHLRAQKGRERLEVVMVAPSRASLNLDDAELRDFHSHRVVEVFPFDSTARARAEGVRAASASIVALVEDHAFPAPGWAEALMERHRESWAAVGPVMANANPRSATSWANLLIEYAPWVEPQEGGEREHLPGHNGSYKRDVLVAYGDALEAMLDAESVLHWDLRARGHRLYLEPRARTFHQNFSLAGASVPLRFNGGRLFAAARARGWPAWRKVMFAAAAPLIPAVRLVRITRELLKPGRPRRAFARALPALAAGLVCDGAGEMVGYAFGAGRAMAKLTDLEFHRRRYLAPHDLTRETAAD
ncbi:MAG TPA: glycosyltransferase [Pyrinomonadaceae bacterium]|nr:glycosyltransferase [Pyrinomonadaceae bacterium]